ncbi:TPA: hypothetical protein DEB29_03515 [Candidatus Wolfebacteria bacterium]|nr:hypothetical protein [Candidatus Wolfebacteria bacterium]
MFAQDFTFLKVFVNDLDISLQVEYGSLEVSQKITSQVDSASFTVRKAGSKTFTPVYGDEVSVYDGDVKIFGGTIVTIQQQHAVGTRGIEYDIKCVDHTYTLDKTLVARTYEGQTITEIIEDIIATYAPTFTTTGVSSSFIIDKIVFNQIAISTCLKRLADIVNYDWYVSEEKDINFFARYEKVAPFDLTDTNGNYINKTLRRNADGSQVANRIKLRGGEYNGLTYSDSITVSGNDSKSFKLPYRFANLTVLLNTVSQNVGIDFIDDFSANDVLYNFQEQMIRFENNLFAGDIIEFSGNPKVPVFAVAEDPVSIAEYGTIEKLIRDDSIESNVVARRRANAELYAYAEPVIDAKFRTYTSGLRAGMILRIQSDVQGIDDELIIKGLTFRMRDHDSFHYDVELISTKRYDFITLMQKILEPDPRPGDERETSEDIFTDTQLVTVQEETEVVASFDDEQQVETQENILLDPLGDDTDAIYVLSPYTPNGQLDTKRPGRIGISLVAY